MFFTFGVIFLVSSGFFLVFELSTHLKRFSVSSIQDFLQYDLFNLRYDHICSLHKCTCPQYDLICLYMIILVPQMTLFSSFKYHYMYYQVNHICPTYGSIFPNITLVVPNGTIFVWMIPKTWLFFVSLLYSCTTAGTKWLRPSCGSTWPQASHTRTIIQLYICTSVQLYNFTTVQLYNCRDEVVWAQLWLHLATGQPNLYNCRTTHMYICTTLQLYNCATVQLCNWRDEPDL